MESPQHKLVDYLQQMLDSEVFADVTLCCGNRRLKAHRVLLSTSSAYLQKLLLNHPCCEHVTLILADVHHEDMAAILLLIYTGQVSVAKQRFQSFMATADLLDINILNSMRDHKDSRRFELASSHEVPPQPCKEEAKETELKFKFTTECCHTARCLTTRESNPRPDLTVSEILSNLPGMTISKVTPPSANEARPHAKPLPSLMPITNGQAARRAGGVAAREGGNAPKRRMPELAHAHNDDVQILGSAVRRCTNHEQPRHSMSNYTRKPPDIQILEKSTNGLIRKVANSLYGPTPVLNNLCTSKKPLITFQKTKYNPPPSENYILNRTLSTQTTMIKNHMLPQHSLTKVIGPENVNGSVPKPPQPQLYNYIRKETFFNNKDIRVMATVPVQTRPPQVISGPVIRKETVFNNKDIRVTATVPVETRPPQVISGPVTATGNSCSLSVHDNSGNETAYGARSVAVHSNNTLRTVHNNNSTHVVHRNTGTALVGITGNSGIVTVNDISCPVTTHFNSSNMTARYSNSPLTAQNSMASQVNNSRSEIVYSNRPVLAHNNSSVAIHNTSSVKANGNNCMLVENGKDSPSGAAGNNSGVSGDGNRETVLQECSVKTKVIVLREATMETPQSEANCHAPILKRGLLLRGPVSADPGQGMPSDGVHPSVIRRSQSAGEVVASPLLKSSLERPTAVEPPIPRDSAKTPGEFSCLDCGQCFLLPNLLFDHQITHDGSTPYRCEECGAEFSEKGHWMTSHKKPPPPKPESFDCQHCNKSFITRASLKVHIRTHAGVKPYQCGECGKQFSQLRNFKYHQSIHAGTKEFSTTCPECGKYFNDRGYLSSHMKIHLNKKEYECQYCDKRFNQRVAYNMHVRIHTGLKPHSCPSCTKSFSRKMLLKQHLRIHTGERPFSCDVCGKAFADRSNMSLHMRLHSGIKPYSCAVCSKSFTKKHHLKTHMNFHLGIRPYTCVKCNLTFSQSSNMRTHSKRCLGTGSSQVEQTVDQTATHTDKT